MLFERRGDRAVADRRTLHRFAEQLRQRLVEPLLVGGGKLDQRIPGIGPGERVARGWDKTEDKFQPDTRHQLETRHRLTEAAPHETEQRQRACWIGKPDEGGRTGARRGEELQRGGGDHPTRAFRADEQVLEIVAGVVLTQLGEKIGDAPVGQHDFDAKRQIARIAIGEHGDAAGVGRKIAADGAGAWRRATRGTAGRPLRLRPAPRPA